MTRQPRNQFDVELVAVEQWRGKTYLNATLRCQRAEPRMVA
jgi:hypothetical protein